MPSGSQKDFTMLSGWQSVRGHGAFSSLFTSCGGVLSERAASLEGCVVLRMNAGYHISDARVATYHRPDGDVTWELIA
jgi:hypothetical protein